MSYQKLVINESLELPAGKSAMDMPYSHYRNLVKRNGYVKVVRSLGQLAAWNANKNPELAEWARDFQSKLKRDFGRRESKQEIMNEKFIGPIAKKTMNFTTDQIKKELNVPGLKPEYESFLSKNPGLRGNTTFYVTGATGEELYNAAVAEGFKPTYDTKGRSVIIDVYPGSILLVLRADKKSASDASGDTDPATIDGAEKITSIPKAITKGLLKINDSGAIVPTKEGFKLQVYKTNTWLVPKAKSDLKGAEQYEFPTGSGGKPMVLLKNFF